MIDRARTVLLAVFLLTASHVLAQSGYEPFAPHPIGSNLLNLPSPTVMEKGTWEIRFTHRFAEPINEGDAHSFWGLDGSADIGIGLAWAISRDAEVSLYRSDVQDDFEAAVKFRILQQAPAVPLSITARAGVDIRTAEDLEDRTSAFVQAILSRRIGSRLELYAIPSYASNAGAFDSVFNIPLGAAWMLQPPLSVIVEVIPENRDLEDTDTEFAWAVGLKRAIGGHFFEIILTDSRATHVDQYLGGNFLGGIDAGDIHLGFNIERRF